MNVRNYLLTTERRNLLKVYLIFFFQAEDGIRDRNVTGVQTCALPISSIRKRVRKTLACFFKSSTSMDIRRDLFSASLMIRSAFFSASLMINLDSFEAFPLTSSAVSCATNMDLFNVSSILTK